MHVMTASGIYHCRVLQVNRLLSSTWLVQSCSCFRNLRDAVLLRLRGAVAARTDLNPGQESERNCGECANEDVGSIHALHLLFQCCRVARRPRRPPRVDIRLPGSAVAGGRTAPATPRSYRRCTQATQYRSAPRQKFDCSPRRRAAGTRSRT